MIRRSQALAGGPSALLLVVALYGCGGGQRAEAPASSTPASPALDGSPPAGSVTTAPPPGQAPPPPPVEAEPDRPVERDRRAARAELDRAQADLEAAGGACDAACRALASMERATAHLCSLATEPDDQRRCDDAKQRLTSAQSRVRSACGSCR
jgi:hypothetical protein